MTFGMSGKPDIPVPNGPFRQLNHTYHAAHQIRSDLIRLVDGNDPGQFWPLFGHLPHPGKFRITVPMELNSLDSNHLAAAHQIRSDLIRLVDGNDQGQFWPLA